MTIKQLEQMNEALVKLREEVETKIDNAIEYINRISTGEMEKEDEPIEYPTN